MYFSFLYEMISNNQVPKMTQVCHINLFYNENALPAVEAHVVDLLPGGHDIRKKLSKTKIFGRKKGLDKAHLWSLVVFFFFVLISSKLANSFFPSLFSMPCSANFLFLAFSNS